MANKDPLQNSINKLDNTMNALNKTVKGLTKAFTDMNRTETSRKAPNQSLNIEDALIKALHKYGPHKKSGDKGLYKDYLTAVQKVVNDNRDFLVKYEKIREYGYNKDNPTNKIKDVYGIQEVQKLVNSILNTLENQKRGLSKDDSKHIREDLYGNVKGVSVDSSYKLIQAMNGSSEAVLRTAGVFAQTRSEVVAFQSAIRQATKTVVNNLSGSSKKVNDRLSKMAADSKTLKTVVSNLNHNVNRANRAIEKFTDRLNTASSLITSNNRRMRGSATSINTLVKKIQKTSNTITNIQNSLSKKNSGSSTSAKSSFREQATRNSDRAKQAGFIALLIPALAKLLKKTPITDSLRYLALKLGSGLSGKGEHPVLGAVGLAAAPILSGALFSSVFRRQIMGISGKLFGVPAASSLKGISKYGMPSVNPFWIPKNMNGAKTLSWLHPLRSLQNLQRLVADRTVAFQRGWNAPNDIWRRNFNKVNYGYHSLVRDANGKIMRWKNPLTGRNVPVTRASAGQIMNAKMYDWGTHMARVFKPMSALGKSPFVAGLLKLGGGTLKKLPLIGAALEIPGLIKAGRSGNKEVWGNQLAKSTGGVAGGTIGTIAGSALGSLIGPIGTIVGGALGGIIGDAIGRFVGPHVRKGFQNAMSGLKGTFESIKEHTKGVREGFGKLGESLGRIGAAFGHLLSPLTKLAGGVLDKIGKGVGKIGEWIGKLISSGVEKTIELVVTGVNSFVSKVEVVVNTIADLIDAIANGFHDLGQKLLTMPIIGPMLQKIYGETPDTSTVTDDTNNATQKESERLSKELKKYENPKSKEYKAKRQEFYDRYIQSNIGNYQKKGLLGIKYVPEEENKKLEAAANAWADKMMNEEKYRLKVQQSAVNNAIGTSTLPKNLKTYTKNGIRTYAMKDLGLKGAIGRGNSVPYIAAANAQNLKNLDNYLTSKGYKFTYTSAMGGSHAGGARSHGAGAKVDLVLNNGGRLKAEDERWLKAHGFYGGATGAVGYHNAGSGYHYDLSVSGGKGLTAAQMAKQQKTATQTATTTQTKEETASSEIRSGLASIVGAKNKSNKQEKARNIIFSAVDVTGSLGVWGITQLNNGVMRTGR